jgi:CspA family cold shock protein
MAQGSVKWFSPAKGYGFIHPNSGGSDVFVHISAVERSGLSTLNEGQAIEYDTVRNRGIDSADKLKLRAMLQGHRKRLNEGSENENRLRTSSTKKTKAADLDIFLREKNVALYRRLLNPRTDAAKRKAILGLLAKEMHTLKDTH